LVTISSESSGEAPDEFAKGEACTGRVWGSQQKILATKTRGKKRTEVFMALLFRRFSQFG
jgi:hypothetical protein